MPSAHVDEYTSETLPNDKDFQKKYLLLNRFIGLLKIESIKNAQTVN